MEITIETERFLIITPRRFETRSWCASCGRQVRMVTVDEAARCLCLSSRLIYRWIEDQTLHYTETADRRLLVCLNSMPQPGNAAS